MVIMNKVWSKKHLLALTCSSLTFALAVGGVAQAQVDQIVVSAQKREQNLQDVPVAVTAIGGDAVKDLALRENREIADFVPNVEISNPAGDGNQVVIFIRGVGLNDFATNNTSANAVYVDEVFYSSPIAIPFQFLDVERVEVLKGPQGTLYGRNATGGAVNFFSGQPTDELYLSAEASYSSFETTHFEGVVSGPLSDAVRGRFAILKNDSEGFLKNLVTGNKLNGTDQLAMRGILDFDLSEDVSLSVNVSYGKLDAPTDQYRMKGVLDPVTFEPCSSERIQAYECANALGYVPPADFYEGEYDNEVDNEVEVITASGKFVWDLSDTIQLTSITSYQDVDSLNAEDADSSPIPILDTVFGATAKTFTQELRLNGESFDGRLNWVAGAFYLDEEIVQDQSLDLFRALRPFLTDLGGVDLFANFTGAPVYESGGHNEQNAEAIAIYAQGDYALTDRLELTVGLRYGYEDRSFEATAFYLEDDATLAAAIDAVVDFSGDPELAALAPVLFADQVYYQGSKGIDEDSLTFRVAANYAVTDSVSVYGSIASGEKSGGFNGAFLTTPATGGDPDRQVSPFASEKLLAYEIGAKTEFFDRRMRLNLAAFYYDYSDMQVQTTVNAGTSVPVAVLDNADAEIMGAEIELLVNPIDGLTIGANLGLLETELGALINSQGQDFTGNDLAFSPKVSFSGIASYEWELGGLGTITPQFSWSYRGDQFFSTGNNPDIAQDAYWLLNARVAYKSPNGRWEVAAYGKNLTGKEYLVYSFDLSDIGYYQDMLGEPISGGVELRISY